MYHFSKTIIPWELIRQIYVKIDDPEIRMQLKILTSMNKSMASIMKRHLGQWGKKYCIPNPRFAELVKESESKCTTIV